MQLSETELCFRHILYKTRPVVIKCGIQCPE